MENQTKGSKDIYAKNVEKYLWKIQKKHYPDYLKKITIWLYTDGVEITVITLSLEVPYKTVHSWIRAEGEKAIKK